jgi:hypothetical protein
LFRLLLNVGCQQEQIHDLCQASRCDLPHRKFGLVLDVTVTDQLVESDKGLVYLDWRGTYRDKAKLSDLSPLKRMMLSRLDCSSTQVADLTPLTDLSPLKGMPLVRLQIHGTGVSDLTPLIGMPLQEVRLNPKNITQGLDILREIKGLKTIGIDGYQSWPATEFWERYDKGEFNQ